MQINNVIFRRKYVVFTGGLGNQMFQYAFLCGLRQRGIPAIADISIYKCGQMHNGFELNDVFGIDEYMKSRSGLGLLMLKLLRLYGKGYLVCTDDIVVNEPLLYDGYWQDESFFMNCKDVVRKAFTFKNVDDINEGYAYHMRNENSVSLHIRRGDYVGLESVADICSEDYYQNAIDLITSNIQGPIFYVFSDEPGWARQHFNLKGQKFVTLDINHGAESYKDMFLMSQCKHHIIANSSFSWWGAWLGDYQDQIVIAPQRWNNKESKMHPQLRSWMLI